jgi:predicted nucleic acid-binding protein
MTEPSHKRPTLFLDSNVLVAMVRGDPAAVRLTSEEVLNKVQLAVDPVVLSEFLRFTARGDDVSTVSKVEQHWKVLPAPTLPSEDLKQQARSLRNRLVHSNDLLVFLSASQCEYLVTYDRDLQELSVQLGRPRALTPAEALTEIGKLP